MTGRAAQYVVQKIVTWSPGCSRGEAWIALGAQAVRDYRGTGRGRVSQIVAEVEARLWDDPLNRKSTLLSSPSPAGSELLRCAVHYIAHQRNWHLAQSEANAAMFESLPAEATSWARSVAEMVERLYELPPDVIELVRQTASARDLRFPPTLDLNDPADLVDAVETHLSLQHDINIQAWALVSGSALSLAEAREVVELAVRLTRLGSLKSGSSIAWWMIARDFNRRACDGFELELSEFNVVHIPDRESPFREQTRQRMIDLLSRHFENPPRLDRFADRPGESPDEWAKRVLAELKSDPEGTRQRQYPRAAAHVLTGIGDEVAISHIHDWLSRYPDSASALFEGWLFETYDYEITPTGKRRDLVLKFAVALGNGPPPLTDERRYAVEVFRPMNGICGNCGGKLLAFFDILQEQSTVSLVRGAHRVLIPFCSECCETLGGCFSRLELRLDDALDKDAWPARTDGQGSFSLPLRRFAPRSGPQGHSLDASWLGGTPKWEQYPEWPFCDGCRRRMTFAGQVRACHSYYSFYCPDCHTCNVRTQYD